MQGTFIFSGTGNAEGIPAPFCSCEVCSLSSVEERLRSAGILKVNGKTFLIDLGPDLRRQVIKYGVNHIDGAFLTHIHYDHAGGMDDLRAFNMATLLPVNLTLSAFSYSKLLLTKPHLFSNQEAGGSLTAMFDLNILQEEAGQGVVEGIPFRYVTYDQGNIKVNGFRFGNFSYLVDLQKYNPDIKNFLRNLETLVLTISSYKKDPLSMHLSLEEACEFADDIEAQNLIVTHIGHRTKVKEFYRRVGSLTVAYDGLAVGFEL